VRKDFHRGLVEIDDAIGRLENGFLIAAHAVIAVLVVAGVVLRYVFHDPLVWAQEFIVGLFTWAVFIGAAAAMRSRMHIRIEATGPLYSRPRLRFMNAVGLAAGVVVLLGCLWAGFLNTTDIWQVQTPMLGVSQASFDAALPVALVLLLIHCLRIALTEGAARVFRSSTESIGEEPS
jgi:TRAP-type C4-dicarboxylate transport system permease small subunit